ncbi:MAG: hypothetical protein ACTSYR_04080 [Candidatus Odinarchaeia archaeon]
MKKFKTYLPIFNGFYNTIFEADGEDQEIDDINGQRTAKNLPEISFDDCNFNYDEYHKEVSIDVTKYIEKELKDLNFIDSIRFENLYSPKEYNFSNDSINVEIDLSEDNIKEIKKFLYDNLDEYKQYLINNYTSCSGFISFNPNTFAGWVELTKDFTDYSGKEHYLGSVLEFICLMNEINTNSMFEQLTDCNLNATNYSELIGE